LGVARHKALELRKGMQRERPLEDAQLEALVDDQSRTPRPIEMRRLAECLARLNERERSVVLLSYFEEQAADEIARTWGSSPGNVRVVRHRAIGSLKRCMGLGTET